MFSGPTCPLELRFSVMKVIKVDGFSQTGGMDHFQMKANGCAMKTGLVVCKGLVLAIGYAKYLPD